MSEINPKTSADEEFTPPTEAARELGEVAGDMSEASDLLSGTPVQRTSKEPERAGSNERESFEIPDRAVIELGGRTVEAATAEAEEAAPSSFEKTRESIAEEISESIEKWYKYGGAPGLRLPRDFDHLGRMNRDLEGVIDTLTEIKLDMIEFGKKTDGRTASGHNIGLSLHPVLVPWDFFYSHTNKDNLLTSLVPAIKDMREAQGIEEHVLDYPSFLTRNRFNYFKRTRHHEDKYREEYLTPKFKQQGWWGVILAQTGLHAGVSGSPLPADIVTENSRQPYKLNGYRADALGVFEWLSLSLQEDPRAIYGSGKKNFMLGNYAKYNWKYNEEDFGAPHGTWDPENERIEYGWLRDKDSEDADGKDYVIRVAINPSKKKAEEGSS